MNNKLIVGFVVIVLVSVGFYTINRKPVEQETVITAVADQKPNSRYVVYSPSSFADAAGSRRVLFFYASWCPTCRPTDADLKINSGKIPADVKVIRVNYNDPDTDEDERALAKKYAVTYQHTYVQIDGNGKQVTVWNGGKFAELLVNIQ